MARPAPKSLRQLLLRHDLIFVLLIVLTCVVGGTGIYFWQQSSHEFSRINRLIQEIQQTRGDLYRQMKELFDAYFLDDARAEQEYDEYARAVESHFTQLRGMASGQDEQDAVRQLEQNYHEFLQETRDLLERHNTLPNEQLRRALNTDLESGVLSRYEAISAHAEQLLTQKQSELQNQMEMANRLGIVLLLLPIVFAALLLTFSRIYLKRVIVRPISDMLRATSEIRAGRLDHKVPAAQAAELAKLGAAINQMADDLARSREALVRSEKQAAQGALVPMLAHNIRNPLAGIRATAQVADSPELYPETREALSDIVDAVDRLERWTGAMLAYLHPLKSNPAHCKLSAILQGALAPLQKKLKEKNIAVELECDANNDSLFLDEHLLEQMFYNLLANAVDASPSQSGIRIDCRPIGERVKIRIADRGPGMPFKPDAHAQTLSPSTKRFGTGLGIPFAFKACEALGGQLGFHAHEGGGTVVEVEIPRAMAGFAV
ncbi:MAG: HAMP domain-containing protein [Methylobacillus sp.]|jgi:signal transduction histidine kinase|nr:HAMP domain-containing protein [Methylobacillus sp.]